MDFVQVAERCTPNAHAQLFTEILDKYLYFFEAGNEMIPPGNIATLKALIDKHMDTAGEGNFLKLIPANLLFLTFSIY